MNEYTGRRGRSRVRRGETNPQARLNPERVRALRWCVLEEGRTLKEAAALFGVCEATASEVVRGLRWGHVGGASPGLRYQRGSASHRATITEDDVRAIRARHAAGELQRDLAAAYGLAAGTVSQIVHRTRWKHVD